MLVKMTLTFKQTDSAKNVRNRIRHDFETALIANSDLGRNIKFIFEVSITWNPLETGADSKGYKTQRLLNHILNMPDRVTMLEESFPYTVEIRECTPDEYEAYYK